MTKYKTFPLIMNAKLLQQGSKLKHKNCLTSHQLASGKILLTNKTLQVDTKFTLGPVHVHVHLQVGYTVNTRV